MFKLQLLLFGILPIMFLNHLRIFNFRNLQSVELSLPENGYCIISGPNGSGKTSLLEAIYALTYGKSFRTSDPTQLVQNGQDNFTLFASLVSDNNQETTIGVQRDRKNGIIAKCMGKSVKFSEITRMLPVRVISPTEAYTLINGGPEHRRRFLDWGVFHVKHSYWEIHRKLTRIIKQKSAALKMRCSDQELLQWNQILREQSYALDKMRQEYIEQLTQLLTKYQAKLPVIGDVVLEYFPGWDPNEGDLSTQLSTVLKQERQQGHCLIGPHRADLHFKTAFGGSKDQLSRGRQKILAIALYLAQGELLYQETGRHPLYMIDDFSSELDIDAQQLLIEALDPSDKQVIITTLDVKNPVLEKNFYKNQLVRRYSISAGNVLVDVGATGWSPS